jgi:hypothetical protein
MLVGCYGAEFPFDLLEMFSVYWLMGASTTQALRGGARVDFLVVRPKSRSILGFPLASMQSKASGLFLFPAQAQLSSD